VLLVEGVNDCHVVMSLCAAHHVPETFGVYECGSDNQLLRRLNALVLEPEGPKIIGVMLDADKPDVAGRWNSIVAKLGRHGFEFPEYPDATGTVIAKISELPKLGIWLMPDNTNRGMLEDFCLEMADAPAVLFAKETVETAVKRGMTTFKEAHQAKAVVHTFLAWHDEPGQPLGRAITAHALRPDTRTAHIFVEWLNRLFNA
jgi:hypothetical protein